MTSFACSRSSASATDVSSTASTLPNRSKSTAGPCALGSRATSPNANTPKKRCGNVRYYSPAYSSRVRLFWRFRDREMAPISMSTRRGSRPPAIATRRRWHVRPRNSVFGRIKDVRDRFVARLVKEGSVRNYPAKFHAKDGRDIDVIVAGEYMDFRDEPRLLVAAHDITERKRVEDALRESEERLKSIIENSSSAIFLKDLNGRYLLANSMFKEWYGISNTEVVGQTSHDIFPSDLAERVVGMDTKVLDQRFCIRD